MKIYFVDSFTNEKFKGNPAAVCLPDQMLDDETMQNIASEIGFSETAFIENIEENSFKIRFFTPKLEIPLCGHATLASAKVLFNFTTFTTLKFINCDGIELLIEKVGDKIKMQFPVYDTESIKVSSAMLEALGISATVNQRFNKELKIVLLEIENTAELSHLKPDFAALLNTHTGINGVLVTAVSDHPDFDFQYRYFWPWAGTDEDPVTGAVQTFLSKYWAAKLNKTTFRVLQCSARTGQMNTELHEDTVHILGEAVVLLDGQFNI